MDRLTLVLVFSDTCAKFAVPHQFLERGLVFRRGSTTKARPFVPSAAFESAKTLNEEFHAGRCKCAILNPFLLVSSRVFS